MLVCFYVGVGECVVYVGGELWIVYYVVCVVDGYCVVDL